MRTALCSSEVHPGLFNKTEKPINARCFNSIVYFTVCICIYNIIDPLTHSVKAFNTFLCILSVFFLFFFPAVC